MHLMHLLPYLALVFLVFVCFVDCARVAVSLPEVHCREWQRQLDRVVSGRRVGMLWMDTTDLVATLRKTVTRALATLCTVLEIGAHNRVAAALVQLQNVVKGLKERPQGLAAFATFVEQYQGSLKGQDALLEEGAMVKVCCYD